jgi:hypothetical protein
MVVTKHSKKNSKMRKYSNKKKYKKFHNNGTIEKNEKNEKNTMKGSGGFEGKHYKAVHETFVKPKISSYFTNPKKIRQTYKNRTAFSEVAKAARKVNQIISKNKGQQSVNSQFAKRALDALLGRKKINTEKYSQLLANDKPKTLNLSNSELPKLNLLTYRPGVQIIPDILKPLTQISTPTGNVSLPELKGLIPPKVITEQAPILPQSYRDIATGAYNGIQDKPSLLKAHTSKNPIYKKQRADYIAAENLNKTLKKLAKKHAKTPLNSNSQKEFQRKQEEFLKRYQSSPDSEFAKSQLSKLGLTTPEVKNNPISGLNLPVSGSSNTEEGPGSRFPNASILSTKEAQKLAQRTLRSKNLSVKKGTGNFSGLVLGSNANLQPRTEPGPLSTAIISNRELGNLFSFT